MLFEDDDLAVEAIWLANRNVLGCMVMDIWHPVFKRIRNHPQFKALLREIGFIAHCRKTGEWGEFLRPVGGDDFEVAT